MRYDSFRHHRRSIRMKGYDYTSEGAYFVTVCTEDRENLFGNVAGGDVQLNGAGLMVKKWWTKLPTKFPSIVNDEFVIMPNHFHGIAWIVGADPCVCPTDPCVCPNGHHHDDGPGNHRDRGARTAPLHRVIQWFKTMTTNEYIRGIKEKRWAAVEKLWQRNYYERIIRTDDELDRIRQYIRENPENWDRDQENPIGYGLK